MLLASAHLLETAFRSWTADNAVLKLSTNMKYTVFFVELVSTYYYPNKDGVLWVICWTDWDHDASVVVAYVVVDRADRPCGIQPHRFVWRICRKMCSGLECSTNVAYQCMHVMWAALIIIIIIINPLTARVVEAPQMILQPVFSIFPCSPLPSGTCRTPGLSIP